MSADFWSFLQIFADFCRFWHFLACTRDPQAYKPENGKATPPLTQKCAPPLTSEIRKEDRNACCFGSGDGLCRFLRVCFLEHKE